MSPLDVGAPPPAPDPAPGAPQGGGAAAGPSVWARCAQIYVRPFQAWQGLETKARWWFPLAIMLAIHVAGLSATYHRSLLPTMVESWNDQAERGQMSPGQVDKIEAFFADDPRGMMVVVGQQLLAVPIITLLVALVAWFGIGFVLGTRFRYRSALEVVCWAGLVRLPETVMTFAIAWSQETFKGIHFGLAALLPPVEAPTKIHAALEVLLDSVGPFTIWYLFIAIAGCSALSGAPRKNVAWVLTALYLALTVVFALVAGVFGPGA